MKASFRVFFCNLAIFELINLVPAYKRPGNIYPIYDTFHNNKYYQYIKIIIEKANQEVIFCKYPQ